MKLLRGIFALTVLLPYSSQAVFPLIQQLSEFYNAKCVEILYDTAAIPLYCSNRWIFFKNLFASQMTTAYPLEEFMIAKTTEGEVSSSRCNTPLMVTFGRSDKRFLYEKVSRWNASQRRRSVSLVFVTESSMVNFFDNASVPIHLLNFAAVPRSPELIDLYAVFKVDEVHPARVRKVGNWSSKMGLVIDNAVISLERRNFEGKVITTASPKFCSGGGFSSENVTGRYCRVWRTIEEELNITTMQFQLVQFAGAGVGQQDKTQTEMIDALLAHQVDAILADVTLTPERTGVVDFVNVYPFSASYLYFKQIESQLTWLVIMQPFECPVWWTIIVMSSALILSLCLTLYVYGKNGVEFDTSVSYADIMFYVTRAPLVQAVDPIIATPTVRFLFILAYVLTIIFITAYSVNLILFITKDSPSPPFEDLQALLDDGSYKVLLHPNSIYEDYFANSTDKRKREVYEKLSVRFQQFYYPNGSSTGLEVLCGNRKVGLMESEQVINFPELKAIGCVPRPLLDVELKTPQGMAFAKGSSFSHVARSLVTRLKETGLVQRSLRQLLPADVETSDEGVRPIGLKEVFVLFVTWMIGIGVSLAVLAVEFAWLRFSKRNQQRAEELA